MQVFALYRPAPPPVPSEFPELDKVGHLAMFAAPVCFILLARRPRVGWAARWWLWLVPGVFVAHAVLSEIIQGAFYRFRSGDPVDALADTLGVALGVGLAWVIGRRLSPGTRTTAGRSGQVITRTGDHDRSRSR